MRHREAEFPASVWLGPSHSEAVMNSARGVFDHASTASFICATATALSGPIDEDDREEVGERAGRKGPKAGKIAPRVEGHPGARVP